MANEEKVVTNFTPPSDNWMDTKVEITKDNAIARKRGTVNLNRLLECRKKKNIGFQHFF